MKWLWMFGVLMVSTHVFANAQEQKFAQYQSTYLQLVTDYPNAFQRINALYSSHLFDQSELGQLFEFLVLAGYYDRWTSLPFPNLELVEIQPH
ncbi:hypothetical protein DXV75_01235 [Alteromonas aestuariivivens]|uniref:Uncharacterized protein n=1 Tax=Alteromonas aestuariivivens TaxID=1938339 RepID=A0A3D8MF28_9ALTE|nr:hypothetical protein [Alteromonas aestuariivivens]RDV29114.1 hypothetical protein DXV75_01235 [Alteromonas aestuariivivens]